MLVVAIDIGGTFTDLIGFDEKTNAFIQAKSLTTPAQLVQGIIDCLNKSGIKSDEIDELIHGSTIAINTVLLFAALADKPNPKYPSSAGD